MNLLTLRPMHDTCLFITQGNFSKDFTKFLVKVNQFEPV